MRLAGSEVKVLLINCGQEDFAIKRGMRIAQTVIASVLQVNVCALEPQQNESTKNTVGNRGAGGFGSTGHD
ncbi:hypothetical protein AT243_00210 [Bartonella henselae]|nr:hypothetical protein AT243_00210 [Bartonella henselae]